MPVRATKRGAERTPFPPDARYDVVICGASFAGLAVARELRASRARVLVLDRYEIGERQTSACCAPTEWLENLDLEASIKQTFDSMVLHTIGAHIRWRLPYTFSTFDYRADLRPALEAVRRRGVRDREDRRADREHRAYRPRRRSADLIVDGLGWRRVLSNAEPIQPPEATLSRGLEVHPHGSAPDLQLWVDPRYVPSGYGWNFPAGDELRIGIGAYDPRFHVKEPTNRLAIDEGADTVRYQGNWIPHRIRAATEDGVFFVGDSAATASR